MAGFCRQTYLGWAAICEVVYGGLSMRHIHTWVLANELCVVEGPGIVTGLGVFDSLGIVEGQDFGVVNSKDLA